MPMCPLNSRSGLDQVRGGANSREYALTPHLPGAGLRASTVGIHTINAIFPSHMNSARFTLKAVLTFVLIASSHSAADYVWWEGEAAREHGFNNRDFSPSHYGEKAQGLSGGDWLNTGGRRDSTVRAVWTVDVPSDGRWFFHTRVFWKHGPFRWRFDEAEWQTCGGDRGLLDSYTLATHIGANWVSLGQVDLKQGARRFEIELLQRDGAACFDCFVLTRAPFEPKGKLKPGEKYGLADDGWWSFEPAPDVFSAEALLDLRRLNEPLAGEKGFLAQRGDDFIDGSGNPVRFWAVNSGHGLLELDESSIDYFAARMAKMGVNMVRMHGAIFDRDGNDPLAIKEHELAKLHYAVQAFRKQGIYTHLSPFFPLWMNVKRSDGIPGYEDRQKHPFGLLFFDPRMQEIYKTWTKALLTTRDPRSGRSLAEEPAVGIYEIINEDSLFFWTFAQRNVGTSQWADLERRFAAWAGATYGSVDEAKAAWQNERHAHDGDGRLGLYDPWDLTTDGRRQAGRGKRARALAQARFYAETQHGFYAGMTRWLREECGFKAPVSASNWTTADNGSLGALERWSYTAAGVIDRHGYFGGKHEGEASGYSVRAGHTYEDRCALLDPADLPIKFNQVAGHPHIITEIAWNKPNRFIADNTMVLSAYAALQGIDGIFVFATGNGLWNSSGDGKWTINMPGEAGQFPAAALSYRLGLIAPGETVFRQAMTREQLWSLENTGLSEGRNSDFRTADGAQTDGGAGDPLGFFVGRVERSFDPAAKPVALDLSQFIDRAAKTVRSTNGELHWDWDRGLLKVNAPASQGASGHLGKAGAIALEDVHIDSPLDYGTVWVVALDGQPLKSSQRILVQAFSEERMYGFRTEGNRITDVGQAPINVRDLAGTVSLPGNLTGTVLDEHGYARGPAEVRREAGRTILSLPRDSLYTVLGR